jgi:hypothetical protein
MNASMWDATISVASSSNFGPDWDMVDIDPSQPAYAAFIKPKEMTVRRTEYSTFGRDIKTAEKGIIDDGYAVAESSYKWLNRDQNQKVQPRPRIRDYFGRRVATPGPLDYNALDAVKTTHYRHHKAKIYGKWKNTVFLSDKVPGPASYVLPDALNVAPVKQLLPGETIKKKIKKSYEPSIKELRDAQFLDPGPCTYKPDYTKVVTTRQRPIMRPRSRVASSRIVLDLRNIEIDPTSTKEHAKKLNVDDLGLKRGLVVPGPATYADYTLNEPRPYDNFKHTSTKETLGERRKFKVGGRLDDDDDRRGPGHYKEIYKHLGEFDVRFKPSDRVRSTMKTTSALPGSVPWPHLVPPSNRSKIKSNQLSANYNSAYSFPKHKQTFLKEMGSIRNRSNVQNMVQHFDPAKATMKT